MWRRRLAVRGEPRPARGRRGLGLRPLAGARRTRSTRTACASRVPARSSAASTRPPTPGALPACDSASSPSRACTRPQRWSDGACLRETRRSAPCRTAQATRSSSPSTSREVIRGTTFPAGHVIEPGHVGWDTKGDTHIGPFEAQPAPMEKVEALADVVHPGRACARMRSTDARAPMAQADLQRGLERDRRRHPLHARPDRRVPPTRAELAWAVMAEGRAVADAQGIMLDQSPEELFDYAARGRSPTATSRACCRTSRRAARPRSTS